MNTGLYFSAAKVLTRWLICAGATLSLTLAILVASAADAATSVTVVGLFPGKAVVVINGQAPRTLSVGDKTAEGVTLLATTADTVRSSAPATPLVKEVAARQRALVLEISETWKPVASVWRLEVQITSDRSETYTNVLSWK